MLLDRSEEILMKWKKKKRKLETHRTHRLREGRIGKESQLCDGSPHDPIDTAGPICGHDVQFQHASSGINQSNQSIDHKPAHVQAES
jgi:hypothetical protein